MAVRRLSLLSLWLVYLKCVAAAIDLSDTSALKNVPNCLEKSDLKPLSPTITYLIIPPQTVFVGGYTVFTLSDRTNDRPTERVSVTFCFLNNFKNH